MQYAAAAGSDDVDRMKLMRDVPSTQETGPYVPHFSRLTPRRCDHFFAPFCHPFVAL